MDYRIIMTGLMLTLSIPSTMRACEAPIAENNSSHRRIINKENNLVANDDAQRSSLHNDAIATIMTTDTQGCLQCCVGTVGCCLLCTVAFAARHLGLE